MKMLVGTLAAILAAGAMGAEKLPPSNVDSGFVQTSKQVQVHRQKRLVPLDAFLAMAKDPDTILLDTRSEYELANLVRADHKKLKFEGSEVK